MNSSGYCGGYTCVQMASQPQKSSMLQRVTMLLAAALFLATSGCSTARYPPMSIHQANAELTGGYRLGAGDKLRVTVFDEPSLTGDYTVGVGGTVSMPLIAEVSASDVNPQVLAERIGEKLTAGGYVLSPRVAVEVLTFRPFYVLGEVNDPGEFPYSGELSLLQAIAKAGGFTSRANKSFVVVRRPGWETGREILVGDPPLLIAPGDTVMVTESLF